nr:Cki family colicin immunity protein [Escherichia coli]
MTVKYYLHNLLESLIPWLFYLLLNYKTGLSDSGYCRPKRTGATAAVPVSEDLTFSMAVHPGRPYASMTQVVFPHNVPAAAHVPHP